MTSNIDLRLGDCLEVMKALPDESVDAVVCDPPYGLSFMGKKWDYDVPSVAIWAECLRVLKPGGHLLAFAGTRTQHRMACRIEDAGFEIRDVVAWMYGSGFPKSLDVSKAIDKAAGAERQVIGRARGAGTKDPDSFGNGHNPEYDLTAPATDAAKQWAGWGTALKPAFEPCTLSRKPLIGTVAENVLAHGTGGLNIDDCRIPYGDEVPSIGGRGKHGRGDGYGFKPLGEAGVINTTGRWPANIIHDGSPEVVACFPNNAQRFFYCAKVSPSERGASTHPTMKPIAVMEWLVKLVTPEGATVLDPFMGSGTTGIACKNLNRNFIGIELDPQYFEIAKARIENTPWRLV